MRPDWVSIGLRGRNVERFSQGIADILVRIASPRVAHCVDGQLADAVDASRDSVPEGCDAHAVVWVALRRGDVRISFRGVHHVRPCEGFA